jgi:hypothetical protein
MSKSIPEEAARIRELKTWPRWPWLPLKRGLETGVIYADDIDLPDNKDANGPIRVFDINVFGVTMKAAVALTQGVPCPWKIHGTYTDVEAMLDDGWKVD